MPELIHRSLADGRWFTFSLVEQLANVGSDVGRAITAKGRGDERRMWTALERALELFDLTSADPKHPPHRVREIRRAREVVCDFLVGDNEYRSTAESLERYFLAFAVAARRGASTPDEPTTPPAGTSA